MIIILCVYCLHGNYLPLSLIFCVKLSMSTRGVFVSISHLSPSVCQCLPSFFSLVQIPRGLCVCLRDVVVVVTDFLINKCFFNIFYFLLSKFAFSSVEWKCVEAGRSQGLGKYCPSPQECTRASMHTACAVMPFRALCRASTAIRPDGAGASICYFDRTTRVEQRFLFFFVVVVIFIVVSVCWSLHLQLYCLFVCLFISFGE